MRTLIGSLLVVLVLFGLGAPRAPADEPAAAPEEGEGNGSTPWFATILPPSEAWAKLQASLREHPRAQWRAVQKERALAYVKAFDAAGAQADADEVPTLFRFYLVAEQYGSAAAAARQLLEAEEVENDVRDQGAVSLAQLLANAQARDALAEETLAGIAETVEGYLAARTGEDGARVRAQLHRMLAMHASRADDDATSIRHTMLSAMEDPSLAAAAGRTLVRTLQSSTHDLEGYEAVRAGAAACLPVLQHLAATHLAAVQEEGDERTLRRAEAGVRILETAGRPIAMLGAPAPPWTAEHAYGDVSALDDLAGKVVVLDFWATWCPWCIRSFPALRDLLRDYADEGLVVVGVTASASSVYEQRYDLDDDLKDRAEEGVRPVAVARLARGEPNPEATPPQLPEEEYREVERQAIERFIENHEMTWPVVMIDKAEPGEKYALTGWPHAVVIDRAGRVRYFKSGALLRDRPEAVAAFRAVLEDLLAEEEPIPGE